MNKKRTAGLLWGPMLHHLDHIAPLCSLLDIPLIVTEENLKDLAEKYYPALSVIYWHYYDAPYQILSSFDHLFSCLPRPLIDEVLWIFQKSANKEISSTWLPHGNSDKGHTSFHMEGLKHDTSALFYGKKMVDFFTAKQALRGIKESVIVGNFRKTYFLKHKAFYSQLSIFEDAPFKPLILYAPTWEDAEGGSSFKKALPHLIKNLPSDYALMIKPHPLLSSHEDVRLLLRAEEKKDVFVLRDFPPIYPLLEKIAVYIGDTSSIGYDFLYFDKPMIFLKPAKVKTALLQCGLVLSPKEYGKIYQKFHEEKPYDQERFSAMRKKMYEECYGKEKSWDAIRKEIVVKIGV